MDIGTDQRKDGPLTTEIPEHTLICTCMGYEFEVSYRSKEIPDNEIPVNQIVRAINTFDKFCKSKNIATTGAEEMTIKVKEAG